MAARTISRAQENRLFARAEALGFRITDWIDDGNTQRFALYDARNVTADLIPGTAVVGQPTNTAGATAEQLERWLAEREALATDLDATSSTTANPIRAFVAASKTENCHCGDVRYDRGRALVETMAAQLKDDDDAPTLVLTSDQCSDVLHFVTRRTSVDKGKGAIRWAGGGATDAESDRFGGDPGFGLFLILHHVAEQVRTGVRTAIDEQAEPELASTRGAAPELALADKYTLLRNPNGRRCELSDAIYAVKSIGRSINDAVERKQSETVLGLAGALEVVGKQLEVAIGSVDINDESVVLRSGGAS